MNRQSAPEIKEITGIKTGFPEPDGNVFSVHSEEGVFKLEIIFPDAGYGVSHGKFERIYALDLLLSGTPDKSASDIAGEIDSLGGYVFKSCDYYTSSITLFGLNENFERILSIVKNALDECNFREDELSTYKTKKVSELNINLNKTSFLANRRINDMLFGPEHPYAYHSSEDRIQKVNSESLRSFKQNALTNPFFIFTGSETLPIKEILSKAGYLTSTKIELGNSDILPESYKIELYCEKKGATQNSIRFGKILPSREHPDYFKINMFNLILGGYFGSRLMKNIREEKGLTYGIHSSVNPFRAYSLFKISSECNNQLSETVKTEIIKEIETLQRVPVADEELRIAKNYLSGVLLRSFDGAFSISERLKIFLELNSTDDYYQRYFSAIHSITAAEIQETANNYFEINSLEYCIAGEK